MSRSNPTESTHPCERWMQWNGQKGIFEWYNKETEEKIPVKDLTFLVLDELATIKGWDEANKAGIFSNEVRSTVTNPFLVKSFKGGEIANGLYKDIKDTIKANGARYNANVYVAFKNNEGVLVIGSVMLKGAALSAWMDFKKENKTGVATQAVRVIGAGKGKKGTITYKYPKFELYPVDEDTNNEAVELDKVLQAHLEQYFNQKSYGSYREVEETVIQDDGLDVNGARKDTSFTPPGASLVPDEDSDLPF